tara:strand:- start:1342 stop:1872 length:531 start_codon:yes stop_codon:yes gene_type:complete
MKKVLISLLLFFVLVFTFLVLGPFLTLYSLKESIEEKDSSKLSKNIYFPELRSNLKNQINLSLSDRIDKKLNENLLRFLAEELADIVVDETLDVFLTPDGLGRLIDGEDPSSIIRNNKKLDKKDDGIEVLESIRFKYQSVYRFIVLINTVNNKQIILHLDRFGIRWKLVNIVLPLK